MSRRPFFCDTTANPVCYLSINLLTVDVSVSGFSAIAFLASAWVGPVVVSHLAIDL